MSSSTPSRRTLADLEAALARATDRLAQLGRETAALRVQSEADRRVALALAYRIEQLERAVGNRARGEVAP